MSNTIAKSLGDDHANIIKTTQSVDLIVDSASVAWIVMDNKTKGVNVIDLDFVEDMNSVLDVVEDLLQNKPTIKIIIFISAKKDSFVVGADIASIYGVLDQKVAEAGSRRGQALFDRINALRIPTVAAINGVALGGGLELALACTYRFSVEGKKPTLGLPEIKLGVIPGAGGTVRLPKVIGLQESLGIILQGGSISPKKAKTLGLVDELIPSNDRFVGEDRFLWNVRRLAIEVMDNGTTKKNYHANSIKNLALDGTRLGRKIVGNAALKKLDQNTKGKYPAPYAALESVMNSFKEPNQRALHTEAQLFGRMAVTPECKNQIAVFNMMESTKKINNRFNQDEQPIPIRDVSVIGAGVMGSGIAQLILSKGLSVYMKDIQDDFVQRGLDYIKNILSESVSRGRLSPEESKSRLSKLTSGTQYQPLTNSQIVIEAAVERMDLKKKILQDVESISSDIIFATNTSTLSIDELASASKNPSHVIGMHFFNPVHKMPLVEIITGKQTSPKVISTVYALSLRLGKTPIV
ncbi:fatty acid oxidation complex subunit alpha, partial [Acrasis kona]